MQSAAKVCNVSYSPSSSPPRCGERSWNGFTLRENPFPGQDGQMLQESDECTCLVWRFTKVFLSHIAFRIIAFSLIRNPAVNWSQKMHFLSLIWISISNLVDFCFSWGQCTMCKPCQVCALFVRPLLPLCLVCLTVQSVQCVHSLSTLPNEDVSPTLTPAACPPLTLYHPQPPMTF